MTKTVVACYYNWHNTCLIQGKTTNDNQANPILVVESHKVESQLSVWEAADLIKAYLHEKWINKHEPLKQQLSCSCHEVDFRGEHENEIEAIQDLYFSLKTADKLIIPEDLNFKENHVSMCLSILLKALTPHLRQRTYATGVISDKCHPKESITSIFLGNQTIQQATNDFRRSLFRY